MRSFDTVVRLGGLAFGEAPRWHEGRLWFSDFFRRGVFSFGEDGERQEHALGAQPSGLGWLADGTLLVVSMVDCRVLALSPDGAARAYADISAHCGYWANDLVVAADGTAYVSNFGFDLDTWLEGLAARPRGAVVPDPPATTLVRVAPDGTVSAAAEGLSFPNGMVLTEDGATLVVAETLARRLTAFDVAVDGTLACRRTFAGVSGAPDGICLDAEGQIWVANALASECLRVADGGEVTARVATQRPCFACMLGGEDRRELFCVTATSSIAKVAAAARDGQIESVRVDVPGAGRP